ncbi:helix-turn-helix domain-containing protein [Tautonia sp. JC769]|uniref:helix-turn-helix domain-containing protein n=1 Tax=Tautonia sp. JC769 TaxID=3232135 RepID=UPI003458A176
MRVREAAQRLDVSPGTVYALVASGRLRCYRVGMGRGSIRISEEHLAEYLRASEPSPPPGQGRGAEAPAPPHPRLKHLRVRRGDRGAG